MADVSVQGQERRDQKEEKEKSEETQEEAEEPEEMKVSEERHEEGEIDHIVAVQIHEDTDDSMGSERGVITDVPSKPYLGKRRSEKDSLLESLPSITGTENGIQDFMAQETQKEEPLGTFYPVPKKS